MRRFLVLLIIAAATLLAETGGAPRPSERTIREWQDRKFGMFIHFGLYSTLGGVWNGRKITNGYSEQIQSHAPIPMPEYEPLAKAFDPVKWDPDAVARLAKDAGMRFIVITAKHHDGFNMFGTRLTRYNIVDSTPYRRDVVKGLAEACARHGLGFGVYYSTIDWHFPGVTWRDDNNNEIAPKQADFNVGQLRELLTGYGPLSEVWFDMGNPTPEQSKRFADTVHSLQPECMVSGRVFNHEGDFTVMGDNDIPQFVIDEPWQTPASIYDETWGYRSWQDRKDLVGKTNEHIVKMTTVVSRGGNYLLNIGPRGDGSVVEFEAAVLRGVGAWLARNAEAIYGTGPQPFRKLEFGSATTRPGKLYLMVRNRPADGRLRLPGLQNRIRSAYLLADATRAPLATGKASGIPFVEIGRDLPTPPVTVVALEIEGDARVTPPLVQPGRSGAVELTPDSSDTYYRYNGRGYYDKPAVYKQEWHFGARAGKYEIQVAAGDEPGARVQFTLDGRKLVLPAAVELGSKEYHTLTITPEEPYARGERLRIKVTRVVMRPI